MSRLSRREGAALKIALVLAFASCGGGTTANDVDAAAGSGGRNAGSGGTSSSGGTSGSGGISGTGGTSGTRGTLGSGGTPGSGGTSNSGGTPGTGGTSSSGGVTGSGGVAPPGSGGATTSSGGTPGSGGSAAASGGSGAAGKTGMAGSAGGGASGSGGSSGTGHGVVAAGVRWIGRVDLTTDAQHPRFGWSGTGFVARFTGTSLTAQLNNGSAMLFKPVVDTKPQAVIMAPAGQGSYMLASGLSNDVHTVELYKQTEGAQGNAQLMGLTVGGGGALMAPPDPPDRFLEILGDSITCGYGALGKLADTECLTTESHWDTYGAVTARTLGAELSTIATSGQGIYRNYAGDMTETMPMVWDRTLRNAAMPTWDFRVAPQAVVINLGTNDISNNKGDPGMPFRDLYLGLVQAIRMKYPQALIVLMNGPLLSGNDLSAIKTHLRAVVDARKAAGDSNIEFFDGIDPQTSDKAACQYHPNPAENQIMADKLVAELRARLHW